MKFGFGERINRIHGRDRGGIQEDRKAGMRGVDGVGTRTVVLTERYTDQCS